MVIEFITIFNFFVIPGFDRDLHNVPRLTYTGDADRGVHNLRIENVTLSDITEYQCQVGPGKGNKAIRADAHLNVLGKFLLIFI